MKTYTARAAVRGTSIQTNHETFDFDAKDHDEALSIAIFKCAVNEWWLIQLFEIV